MNNEEITVQEYLRKYSSLTQKMLHTDFHWKKCAMNDINLSTPFMVQRLMHTPFSCLMDETNTKWNMINSQNAHAKYSLQSSIITNSVCYIYKASYTLVEKYIFTSIHLSIGALVCVTVWIVNIFHGIDKYSICIGDKRLRHNIHRYHSLSSW